MPKIKKIKILKNKVTVCFDDQNKIELDKSVYTEFYLYVGKEVSKKEIKQIEDYNLNAALMNYALKIRQKSLYSEYKMRHTNPKHAIVEQETEMIEDMTEGQLAEYLAENFNDY